MSNIATNPYNKIFYNIPKLSYLDNFPVGFYTFWGSAKAPDKSIFALGQTLNRETYKELYNFALENGLIVSEADWQNQKLYGLYSDGDGTTTFRVPLFKGYKLIGFDTAKHTLGKAIEPALPNITGTIQSCTGAWNRGGAATGSFAILSDRGGIGSSGATIYKQDVNFYASRSSSIYKSGTTTVQTPDIAQNVIIKYKM